MKNTKQKIIEALEDEKVSKCSVCGFGWKSYKGNYDELCNKHYLEIEPTN